jgi:hypothetical protein
VREDKVVHETLRFFIMKKNIFALCQECFGYNCFVRKDIAAKVRNTLYRHIRGSCNYSHVVKNIVKDGLIFFAEATESTIEGLVGSNQFENGIEVLYIASHLCQRYDIKDAGLVQKILLTVFDATKTFDPWFEFLDQLSFVFESETNIYPFPYNDTEGHVTKERLGALEYFLQHASNLKVSNVCFQNLAFGTGSMEVRPLLVKHEMTFVDAPLQNCRGCTPLLLACHSSSAKAVQLLLRYGASPFAALRPNLPGILSFNARFHQPLYVLVSKLNALMFWRTHGFHEQTTEEILKIENDMKQREEKLIDCLEMFKRVIPVFPVIVSTNISTAPTNPECQFIHSNFAHLTVKGPACLRHLARCEVRKCIRDSSSLPANLDSLPLPNLMLEYLNLHF